MEGPAGGSSPQGSGGGLRGLRSKVHLGEEASSKGHGEFAQTYYSRPVTVQAALPALGR